MGHFNEKTESVLYYLQNTYNNYCADYPKPAEFLGRQPARIKGLAAMEMLMVLLGKLTAGGPLSIFYESIPREMKLLWLIPIKFEQKENYEEFILRKAAETLEIAKKHK